MSQLAWSSALIFALCLGRDSDRETCRQDRNPEPRDSTPRVYRCDGQALVRARSAKDDPGIAAAIKAITERADRALNEGPFTIVTKPKPPPTGDKHDYISIAPYYWPDPDKPDGLPYIRKDGRHNPEVDKYDRPLLGKMTQAAGDLGLAYYLTGDVRYAEHAAKLLRVWFLDAESYMRPHLNFAQFIPGVNDGRGIGIIETRLLVDVVDAVGLLHGSKHWTKKDQARMEEWFADYLKWMRASKNGQDEDRAANNHGSWYDVQVVTFALFVGDRDLAKKVLEDCKTRRIARQIEPDGRQPLEEKRTRSFDYSEFNLRALICLASLGDRLGVDLWHFETKDGRSIRKALDYLIPFAAGEKEWKHEQINKPRVADLAPLLRRAAVAYDEPRYERLIEKVAPKGLPAVSGLMFPTGK
jgi:hypothetical protein